MKISTKIIIIVIISLIVFIIVSITTFLRTSIKDSTDYSLSPEYDNVNYVQYTNKDLIIRDKSKMKGMFGLYYDKYLAYTAPNKKNIFIVAAKEISDYQLLYAYSVLSNFLNSDNGYDMTKLTNSIANSNSYIVMAGGSDGNSSTPRFAIYGQPLYYSEVAVPGSNWFMENDYNHRDATFEEILHFTHDNGIGTTSNPGVFPSFSEEISNATFNALPQDKALWGIEGLWGYKNGDNSPKKWLLELEKEGSLEQEYLASVIDSYYGLWGAFTELDGGMWGMYVAKTREDIYINDPVGSTLLPYFNDYISSMITLDSSLDGDFHLTFNQSLPYTHKTQYYQYVRLSGDNNTNIYGNAQDNIFIGNAGSNVIDGITGFNIVQYDYISDGFEIDIQQDVVIITNKETNVIDTLYNMSIIRFQDIDISID